MAYNESLLQALNGILNGTNAAAIRRQNIGDFNTFILNHIPYAQVRLRDLQTGLMSFDGPLAPGINGDKPILVWHFGGLPYPIVKAAQVDYTYVRTWDGSGWTIHSSILFGFQSSDDQRLNVSPRARVAMTPQGFRARVDSTTGFVEQLTETVAGLNSTSPSATVKGSVAHTDLDGFLNDELDTLYPKLTASRIPTPVQANDAAVKKQLARVLAGLSPAPALPAARTSTRGRKPPANAAPALTKDFLELLVHIAQQSANGHTTPRGLVLNGGGPLNVEFDGPARDNDSHHIFAYSTETLFNDQDKYNQVLWWYFAGQPVRITKALRIPIGSSSDPNSPSLFVGYSGPGGHP